MVKKELELAGKKPNILAFPQATIDSYKIDDSDKELFDSTVQIFAKRAVSHLTHPHIKRYIKNNFEEFDVIRLPKYPLVVTYNHSTSRIIINISALGKRSVSNIEPRDLYTMVCYGHITRELSFNRLSLSSAESVSDFMSAIYLKIFSKKYGLTGSYMKLIPELRYFVGIFILVSFFDYSPREAYKRALMNSKFDRKELKVDLDKYNFMKISSLIKCLKDSGTLPGLDMYRFISIMIKAFGTTNLPLLEDVMRFSASCFASTVNGNSIVPFYLNSFSREAFKRIIIAIEKSI